MNVPSVRPTSRSTRRPDLRDDAGATAIEYALVASLVAVAVVGGVTLVGQNVLALFQLMPAGL